MKAKALIAVTLLYSVSASAQDEWTYLDYCAVSMKNMVASSNQPLMAAEHVSIQDLEVEAEAHDDAIMLQLFDRRKKSTPDSPGAGMLGWVTYHPANNTLTDGNETALRFDQQKGKRYQQCLSRMQSCADINQQLALDATIAPPRYVVTGTSRAWFYAAPVPQCRSESVFIVPGDIISRVGFVIARDDKTQKRYQALRGNDTHDYVLGAFNDVQGWVEADNLEDVDEVCEDAREKAGMTNPADDDFITRTVANQRLYFYDAPNKACLRQQKAFVVDGDRVQMLNKPAFGGYRFIRYTHPASQKVTEGWVSSEGLVLP
ncbi:hypothetical protein CHU32_19180 [Superficieibacter electus]|uniref:SH3 domain-containing protein n=1 Tax=Superficieibacter electus TaxID=2022662 RepID=A0A2P5GLC7_9ENTR|nr:hypothetical protein [Superficieibacter electus]POP42691.1 hypothetical protein CHU33_18805 [Superficieibacter electus]POP45767.1 hypothetical protein CHU32_19180 [Superficieibacter electus]